MFFVTLLLKDFIDLIFTNQPSLVVDFEAHPSLYPNCHHDWMTKAIKDKIYSKKSLCKSKSFIKLQNALLILPTNCLSVFVHFMKLALKGLIITAWFLFCLFVGKKLKEQVLMFFYSLEIITYLLSP